MEKLKDLEKLKDFITEDDLNKFKEGVIETARENLRRDKQLLPIIHFLFIKDNKLAVALMPVNDFMINDQTKDIMVHLVKKTIDEFNVFALIMIQEAWLSSININEKDTYQGRPSEDPNRKEVMFVSFETKFKCEVTSQEFIKANDEIVFGELISSTQSTGRFSNMLKQNPGLN